MTDIEIKPISCVNNNPISSENFILWVGECPLSEGAAIGTFVWCINTLVAQQPTAFNTIKVSFRPD